MCSIAEEAEVVAWRQANGLQSDADFCHAFCTLEEAVEFGGQDIAEAWLEVRRNPPSLNAASLIRLLPEPKVYMPGARVAQQVTAKAPVKAAQVSRPFRTKGRSNEADLLKRQEAASQVVKIAFSWGPQVGPGLEMNRLQSAAAKQAFFELTVERISRFEAASVDAHRRAWVRWTEWCAKNNDNPLDPSAIAIPLFLRNQKSALSLWNHLQWWERHLGAPVHPQVNDKPSGVGRVLGVAENQAAAADPEVLFVLEQTLSLMTPEDSRRGSVLAAILSWKACLRFAHVQRSSLVSIDKHFVRGFCARGKRKDGFAWAMPRLTVSGASGPGDGSELVSLCNKWKTSEPLRYLAIDPIKGGALSIADFTQDIRSVLAEYSTVDPEIFTSYALRRALPTAAEISKADEPEQLAIGDWQELRGKNPLPLRYAGDKVESAALAKLRQMALVHFTFVLDKEKPLSWSEFRARLSADVHARADQFVRQAISEPGADISLSSTADRRGRPKTFTVVKRKLEITRAVRQEAKRLKTSMPSQASSSSQAVARTDNPMVEEVQWKLADKVNATIHFVDGDLPWCQRKQSRPTRLRTLAGEGRGLSMAQKMGVPICSTCRRIFTITFDHEFLS